MTGQFKVGDKVRVKNGNPDYVGKIIETCIAEDMEGCDAVLCKIDWNRLGEDLVTEFFDMYLEHA